MKNWLVLIGFSLALLAQSSVAQGTRHSTPIPAPLPDFTTLVEQHSPAVVNITTVREGRNIMRGEDLFDQDEMFNLFRRMLPPGSQSRRLPNQKPDQRKPLRHGQGSGFIISHDGYILTNTHVVDNVDEVIVKLQDKRELRAKVIGKDSNTDVALIKIEASGLPAVRIGDPDKLRVGEWVLAIGAPFGFESSVTAGIVSAKGRSLPQENYVPFIQTDVAVNPGNSGGPLFSLRGEVVGMNSQIISRSGGYMGLSFAIPIDVAMDIADQLKANGKVQRGRLGVIIQEVTSDLADSFGLKSPQGALVSQVEPGGPADKAGVQVSDIILKLNGRDVKTSIDLPRMIGALKPGSRATLGVWRKGKMMDISTGIGEMNKEAREAGGIETQPENRAGLVVSELKPEQKRLLKIDNGVLVEEASGPAARAGIQSGDIILAVHNQEVNSSAELARLLSDDRTQVALLVKRGDSAHYVSLRLK